LKDGGDHEEQGKGMVSETDRGRSGAYPVFVDVAEFAKSCAKPHRCRRGDGSSRRRDRRQPSLELSSADTLSFTPTLTETNPLQLSGLRHHLLQCKKVMRLPPMLGLMVMRVVIQIRILLNQVAYLM